MHNALQRNGELRQLEADLGDLHTLFKDVASKRRVGGGSG